MADLYPGTTGTAVLDQSQITLLSKAFLIAAEDNMVVNDVATIKENIGGKAIEIIKYPKLSPSVTSLTELEEVASTAMSDSKVTLQPLEYGQVVTQTSLSSLHSGGMADLAVAEVVGKAMAESWNTLGIQTLEGSSNERVIGGTAEGSMADSATMTVAELLKQYTALAAANIPKFAGDTYVAVMHPHVVHDLLSATGAGSWQDVSKYSSDVRVFKNEIGMVAGFRIVQSTGVSINEDAGTGTVDSYHTACVGVNGLGIGVSKQPSLTITGPYDKLGRMVHVGWYGVYDMEIIDADAVRLITSASSQGAN